MSFFDDVKLLYDGVYAPKYNLGAFGRCFWPVCLAVCVSVEKL